MKKIPKQEYNAEFKELAVKRVKAVQSAGAVDKNFGLVEQTPRKWVKAAAAGNLNIAGAKVVTPEQIGLSQLRAENILLERIYMTFSTGDTYDMIIDKLQSAFNTKLNNSKLSLVT